MKIDQRLGNSGFLDNFFEFSHLFEVDIRRKLFSPWIVCLAFFRNESFLGQFFFVKAICGVQFWEQFWVQNFWSAKLFKIAKKVKENPKTVIRKKSDRVFSPKNVKFSIKKYWKEKNMARQTVEIQKLWRNH